MILGENSSRFFDTNTDLGVTPKDYSHCDSVSEAAMTAVYENEQNWYSLINAINVSELQYALENAGAEMQYEAADIKSILDNVVNIVKSWLSKALGVIQTFAAKVANTFRSASFAAFVKLSKKAIDENGNKSVTIKGYSFDQLQKGLKNISTDMQFTVEDYAEHQTRATTYVTRNNNESAEGISSAKDILDEILGKAEDTTISFNEAYNAVKSSQNITKDINNLSKTCNNLANGMIKSAKMRTNKKDEDSKKATSDLVASCKKVCTVNMYRVQASLKIMAIEFSQAKAVLKKAKSGDTAKQTAQNSSAVIAFGGLDYKLV